MASEPAKKQVPRSVRVIRSGLAIFAAVLVLLLAFGGWLIGTESGARAALSLMSWLAPGPLVVEGIHGRIAGPLQIDRLSLDSPTQKVTLEKLQLDWRARALLGGQLHVQSLRIDRLLVMQKERKKIEPTRLPDNIALPLPLRADSVQLGSGEIRSGAVSLLQLGPVAFSLDFDGSRYQLDLQRFAARSGAQGGAFAGNFKGQASLSAIKPYALQAQLSSGGQATVGQQTLGVTGQIGASGSLEEMAVAADLKSNQSEVKGRAVLRPFSDQVLGATTLSARGVDLSGFKQDLPHTELNLDLSVAESGAGELVMRNADAGRYSEKKMPVADLRIVFRQHPARIDFDHLAATLGEVKRPAGAIVGKGRYADGILSLDLSAKAVNLQGIDKRMKPTQLAGQIGLRHASGRQEFTLDLTEPLKKRQLALTAHGVFSNSVVTIDRAQVRLGDGGIDASGRVELEGAQGFNVKGNVRRFQLKEIGDFARLPDLFLNAQFSLRGVRQPQLLADLSFTITDSRLQGYPLQGEGNAQLRADSVDISKFLLSAGANRLGIQGRLTQSEGQLSFTLNAPKLEQLGPGFAGALDAGGTVRGSFDRPRISANWNGTALRMTDVLQLDSLQGKAEVHIDRNKPFFIDAASAQATVRGLRSSGQRVESLNAQLQFSPQPNAPLNLLVQAQGIAAGGVRAESFKATAAGTTAQHTLDLALIEPEQNWSLHADGGLKALEKSPQWQGTIQRFIASGRFAAQLLAPAPLLVSQQRVQLDRFRLDSPVAHVTIEQFMRDEAGIVTRGNVERLQVAQLLKFGGSEPVVETDLQLGAEWNVRLTDNPAGTLRIHRESGDVVMRGSSRVALGLRNLEASANASGNQVVLQLRAEGKQLGVINAEGKIGLAGGSNRFTPAPDAPVSANINIDIPSLGWASPLVSPTSIVEGRLQSAITVGGTLSGPQLGGKIAGNGLRFLSPETGVDLRHGVLESEFQGSQLRIRTLRFPSPDGQLTASGLVDLADRQPSADIVVKAERFAVLDRSDRRLRISGESRVGWREGLARITGQFKVDSGFIDIGSTSMPTLSDDVVVVGRTEKKATEHGLPAAIDVGIDLANGVALKGRGLNGSLGGQIRLVSSPGEPLRARGTLQIVKGTFSAYGRELVIEQGVLRFNGPINNPALDIRAMRRGQLVEAGVAVLGTALAPRIELVSEPPVPEAEKLSWLVLGHGLEGVGTGEMGSLQNAAGALLSKGAAAGVQSQIAGALGLDQLSVGTTQDSLQERIVTVGKQISSKLFVSLERGLETASSVLHMRYVLSKKVTLEAEAGTRSALSLFYNITFD
jgi:translocation and assembly module TamB